MLLLRTFLILILALSNAVFLSSCGLIEQKTPETEPVSENAALPEWLKLSHRQLDILNLDSEPLDFEETELAAGESDENTNQDPSSDGRKTTPRPNPTGSPYEPGTLDDMIWQQKQKNLQKTEHGLTLY